MRKILATLLFGAILVAASGMAAARTSVDVGVSFGIPGPAYVAPPPVAYYPRPAYVAPAPYYAAPPVYYAPPPVYYGPPVVYRRWHHYPHYYRR